MKITLEQLKLLRVEIDATLVAVAKKHGVAIHAGSASLSRSGDNAYYKLEIAALGEDGTAVSKELADLRSLHKSLGLTEAHLTQEFTVAGRRFVLAGYRNRAPSKPYLVRDLGNQKEYILTVPQVKKALGIPLEKWEVE